LQKSKLGEMLSEVNNMDAKKPETLSAEALHLSKLRDALLHLHKTLVDSERARYEKTIGAVQSPNHFLQLLTNDPWFAWLHPLSLLIVSMDEALEEKEPLTSSIVEALVNRTRQLLVAAENSKDFPGHYDNALQNDPDVVFAHAEAVKLIGRKSPPA
jgi:hypothetical protein